MNIKQVPDRMASLAMLKNKDQTGFEKMLDFLNLPTQEEAKLYQNVLENPLREDKAGSSMEKATLLSLAPEAKEGYITLPRAWEENSEGYDN